MQTRRMKTNISNRYLMFILAAVPLADDLAENPRPHESQAMESQNFTLLYEKFPYLAGLTFITTGQPHLLQNRAHLHHNAILGKLSIIMIARHHVCITL